MLERKTPLCIAWRCRPHLSFRRPCETCSRSPATESGHLRAAGLDVFEHEPPLPDNPLLSRDDVVLSPHNAALSGDTLVAMGRQTVGNVLASLDGTLDPALVVNRETLG